MEPSTPQPRAALKEKLLKLLQTGAAGVVLASATLDTTPASPAPSPRPEESRRSIEQRVDQVRGQLPAGPGFDASTAVAEDSLAWYNWHNWRNGWHNGWHNWHNWHNWW